jgi:hypothetical protein
MGAKRCAARRPASVEKRSARELLSWIHAQGIALTPLDGGMLRWVAPEGTMTDELKEEIKAGKPELLRLLQNDISVSTIPPSLKPIETVYDGYRFRSRLEARSFSRR